MGILISVKEISRQPGAKEHHAFTRAVQLREISQTADVALDIDIMNATSRIIVKGKLQTAIELECSRCDEKFSNSIDISLNEQFLPEGSPELNNKPGQNITDLGIFTYKEEEIDLEEAIRQNIYSSLPMRPMCSEDCRGLCPICGENLNTKKCNCDSKDIDSRMAQFMKFKEE